MFIAPAGGGESHRVAWFPVAGYWSRVGSSAVVSHSSAMLLFYTCRRILRTVLVAVIFLVLLAIVVSSKVLVTDCENLSYL